MAFRRFYRLVTAPDPPLSDFLTYAAQGRIFPDREVQRRAEELSVWDSFERVRRLSMQKPSLGRFVAVLDIPPDVPLSGGRRGHWGIRDAPPERVKMWVVKVVPL